MKRSIAILGRLGAILFAVGLAFLLSSTIQPSQTINSGSSSLQSNTVMSLGSPFVSPIYYNSYLTNLTPEKELNIQLSSDKTIDAYILNDTGALTSWLNQHYPKTTQTFTNSLNATVINEYLQSNPDAILVHKQLQTGTIDYRPTKTMNITILLANLNSNSLQIKYGITILSNVASIPRLQTIGAFSVPIGFIMTLPALSAWINHRKQKAPIQKQ